MVAEGPPAPAAALHESHRRLFFALWPDESMREAMAQAVHEATRALLESGTGRGGRPVPTGNLHVTLAFLGAVPQRRLPELAELAREAARLPRSGAAITGPPASPLELAFDRIEYWRDARLLCALPAEVPAPVAALARSLQELLVARGFAPDLKPFRPHVTVMRKVVRAAALDTMHPVGWRFAELALVESRTLPEGALYSVVGSFPL